VIHYSLICAEGHGFDGWFRDSAAFDAQADSGLVVCPFCRSAKVSRAVMAPSVARGAAPHAKTGGEKPAAPAQGAGAFLDERHTGLRAVIRELREKIVSTTEDVGEKFPNEARKIQDGEAERRAIRGQASLEEARALIEEGIEILPIPGPVNEGS
jgi:hypothetical protein